MKLELLLDLAGAPIPDDRCFVNAARQQEVAALVPLQREDGTLVRIQDLLQLACGHKISIWLQQRLCIGC